MFDLYQFTENQWPGSAPNVCIGRLSEICALIDRGEMATEFGGYIVYEDARGDEYVGVWGNRNASRMRRILRERGARFNQLYDRPHGLRMKQRSVPCNVVDASSELA